MSLITQREDFTQNGQQYDLILAVNGYHPISDYLRALSPEGIYVVAGGSMLQLFQAARQGRQNFKDREPENICRFAGAKPKGFDLYERTP